MFWLARPELYTHRQSIHTEITEKKITNFKKKLGNYFQKKSYQWQKQASKQTNSNYPLSGLNSPFDLESKGKVVVINI